MTNEIDSLIVKEQTIEKQKQVYIYPNCRATLFTLTELLKMPVLELEKNKSGPLTII